MSPRRWRTGGRQQIPRPEWWATLDDGPPAASPLHIDTDQIVRQLEDSRLSRPMKPVFSEARPSAVLVALADDADGDAGVLLTRRSRLLRSHSGEIAFPGGRLDPGETPTRAALREANEEVGLAPRLAHVVGELTHQSTVVSRSYIVPVVVRLPTQIELAPASVEVERVLWVPLHELVRPDTYRAERWGRPPDDRVLHFFELDDETVWGITAFVLADLLGRLTIV